jgi:SAM-dependent methyltransferase
VNRDALPRCTPEAFEQRYREHPDPWNFQTSTYERTRYKMTLEALTQPRYRYAFEPGCSIGELTALLAQRCQQVFATDVSPSAVGRARQRCSTYDNVQIECADLRDLDLQIRPDLIVLSEIAYYFDSRRLTELAHKLGEVLREDGTLIAVHWLGESRDHVLHGDEAHEVLLRQFCLRHEFGKRYSGFRLDRWTRS